MSPISFFLGEVRHQRFGRAAHRLRYAIAYVLVDLDRMAEADTHARLLGVGRGGVMSVRARDHGAGDTDDLAGWARSFLREHGVTEPAARIELLTLPRMFGFVFNPLSVYFVRGPDDAIHHVIYEVNNTFGDRHFYLCAANEQDGVMTHATAKDFYVSPFFEVDGGYRFRLEPPGERVSVGIHYADDEGRPALTASLTGRRATANDAACLKVLAGFPLMTLGVIAGIHWEALKLWLKGARYHAHGPRASTMGVTKQQQPAAPERARPQMKRDAA